jgi:hypothetical protein
MQTFQIDYILISILHKKQVATRQLQLNNLTYFNKNVSITGFNNY